MKKILSILLALCMTLGVRSQENRPFVTASLGTQGTGDVFRGAGVSLGAGYSLKGLDMGISLDYYSDKWGKGILTYVNHTDYEEGAMFTHNVNGTQNNTSMTLRLHLAYDPLFFILGNWRHHLRPAIGLGYSQQRYSSSMFTINGDVQNLQIKEQIQSGFELTLGIGYDFNITHHWAVGVFYEAFIMEREQDILGLRASYSF